MTEYTARDWLEDYDERCAIREYDGGLTRRAAEIMALRECIGLSGKPVGQWLGWLAARSTAT